MSAKAAAGLAGVVAGLLLGGWAGLLAGMAGAGVLLWAAHSPGDGLLLLGPFAGRELVRAGRRPRLFVWRCVVVVIVTLVVASAVGPLSDTRAGIAERATAAENGFAAVAGLTYALAVAVTLAQIPGVIAEERERDRLDHLLVTDLRGREIILGKVAGRLAVLVGYVILPLPVLALLTWLGGVDPRHVVWFGVLSVGTVAGLTGIALFCSSARPTVTDAVVMAVSMSLAVMLLASALYGVSLFLSQEWGPTPAADALAVVGTLNPFVAAARADVSGDPDEFDRLVWPVLRQFAAGHLLVFAAGWALAARNLRLAVAPPAAAEMKKLAREPRPLARPPVTDDPVYWYETTTLTSSREGSRRGRSGVALVIVVVLAGAAVSLILREQKVPRVARTLAEFTGGLAFFAVTLPTAWLASRSTVRERERDTLDALRLTPLEPAEVLAQKWHAAMRCTRGPLLGLVALWTLLAGVGVLPLAAFAGYAATAVACWVLAASAGVRSSVTATTQNQAFMRLGFWAAAWLLVIVMAAGLSPSARGRDEILVAALPPLAQAAAGSIVIQDYPRPELDRRGVFVCLMSVAVAGVMSVTLYRQAVLKFAAQYRPKPEKEPAG